ncbi:hypothetical protein GX865_02415 [Candidatus Saccharibacteria bacterium]|nr:hypothetical protein [Candidatus Saccharibacteria bacterium]
MKKTEIAMIILIASASAIITFFAVNSLLGGKIKQKAKIEETKSIDRELAQPTKRIFNAKSINPTVEVYVKDQGDDGGPSDNVDQ